MDSSQRGALMLVRFIAVALIGLGLIDGLIELNMAWIESSKHHTAMKVSGLILPAVLAVLGIVVLVKAAALAEWISNKLDE